VTEPAIPDEGRVPAAAETEVVLLDRTALEKVRALGGPQLLARLIDMFLENAPARLARALAGAEQADLETVERATHSLKSTAGNLGARRLQQLAETAEDLASARAGTSLAPLLAQLQTVYEETRQALILEREGLDP
jgi:HPt (histidine-containing phosphotransfer) domain-containing protein